MRLVGDYVPPPTQAELTAALLVGQAHLHSLGITAIQDACIGEASELGMPDAFDTYRRAAADRLLTCRVTGALWWDRSRGIHQLDTLQARREAADGGGYFRATSVKLMLDGVCETFTAAMGVPYLDGHGHHTERSGNLFIEPEELAEATACSRTSASRCTSTRSATARCPPRSTRWPRSRPAQRARAGITSRTCSSSDRRTCSDSPSSA